MKNKKKTEVVQSAETHIIENILELKGIVKTFLNGKILANDNVSLSFAKKEVHAIVGENGSGKSTLMNIIFGLYKQDEGDIFINGKIVDMYQSGSAKKYKIGMVHQHFHLVDNFTVLENVILGQEDGGLENNELVSSLGVINKKETTNRFNEICEQYKIEIDPEEKVSKLPVGKRQMVEILKVLWVSKDIIVLDEPTATLSVVEIKDLLRTINSLKDEGKSIIFISHKLDEVKEIADKISILRKGKHINTYKNDSKLTVGKIAKEMVGREVKLSYPKRKIDTKEILNVENISYITSKGFKALDNISFSIKEGEIFGLAGIEGNGQEQVVQIVTGLRKPSDGTITFEDQLICDKNGFKIGVEEKNILISHIPIDRYKHGIIKELTLKYNSLITTFNSSDFSSLWKPKPKNVLEEHKIIELKIKKDILEEETKDSPNTKKIIKLKIKMLKSENHFLEEDPNSENKINENLEKINVLENIDISNVDKKEIDIREKEVALSELEKIKKDYRKLLRRNPGKSWLLNIANADKWTDKIISRLDVEGAFQNSIPIRNLSGGNQQKFVIGREILREHKFLVAGHPTRGLDISAIDNIYKRIIENSNGKATLLYSLEISELVAVCDRIAIMYKGKIIDIINPKETSMDKISKLLIGEVK